MKYVQRKDGVVVGVYDHPQVGEEVKKDADGNRVLVDGKSVLIAVDYAPEQLADDHPEVLAWLTAQAPRVYVRRDAGGAIVEFSRHPREAQDGVPAVDEALPASAPEVLAYIDRFAQAERRAAIDGKRAVALDGSVSWQGKRYHLDLTFQAQLTGLITAFNVGLLLPGATVAIRTFDDESLQLGLDDLKALAGAVLASVQAIYAQSWAEKDALT